MIETKTTLDHQLEQAVLNIGIPPCPEILTKLFAEIKREEPDFQRIDKLISTDVGLSAAIIKTVNSPFYGLRSKVNSVMQAIHILGLSPLSLIVTGMVLRDVLKGMNKQDMSRYWDASSKVAMISSYIAGRLTYIVHEHMRRSIDKDQAYTYGLFQDCGIPIMLGHYPQYKETLGLANQSRGSKFTDIEGLEHEQNHAMIGYYLAKSWGLPEDMYKAIRYHHEHLELAQDKSFLTTQSRDFIGLSLLAEKATQSITGFNLSCEWDKGGVWVMEHFGLTEEDFNSIVKGIRVLYDEGNLNN